MSFLLLHPFSASFRLCLRYSSKPVSISCPDYHQTPISALRCLTPWWAYYITPLPTLLQHTLATRLLFVKLMVDAIIVRRVRSKRCRLTLSCQRWTVNEPDLGRAGTTYARNVQTKFSVPLSALPDPNLLFDTLLKARSVRVIRSQMSDLRPLNAKFTACGPFGWTLWTNFCICLPSISFLVQDKSARLDDQ